MLPQLHARTAQSNYSGFTIWLLWPVSRTRGTLYGKVWQVTWNLLFFPLTMLAKHQIAAGGVYYYHQWSGEDALQFVTLWLLEAVSCVLNQPVIVQWSGYLSVRSSSCIASPVIYVSDFNYFFSGYFTAGFKTVSLLRWCLCQKLNQLAANLVIQCLQPSVKHNLVQSRFSSFYCLCIINTSCVDEITYYSRILCSSSFPPKVSSPVEVVLESLAQGFVNPDVSHLTLTFSNGWHCRVYITGLF